MLSWSCGPSCPYDIAVGRLQVRDAELIGEEENYQNSYLLCHVRGSDGIIVEVAEQIG